VPTGSEGISASLCARGNSWVNLKRHGGYRRSERLLRLYRPMSATARMGPEGCNRFPSQ